MKHTEYLAALVALSLALAAPVSAQGDGDQEAQRKAFRDAQRYNQRQAQRPDQRQAQRPGQPQVRPDQRRAPGNWQPPVQRAGPPDQWRGDRRGNERGAGPDRRFYRGDRLPLEYRHYNYIVDDWRGHYLPAPPRGYYWVQVGADYVLVAIATGIILQLLLSN
ncbi:RcnB family protein [Caenimonas sp. SL110]|uniref:RcnB family protein n=1 Tax=Caenimonas sp. SL110 TaxID=1450524 RepID=UPI000652A2CA|nr:RcnB family protein [Caenimonas sp. SL110]